MARSRTEVDDAIRPMMLQDLRIQCRARGISPAGSRPTLADRLAEHMIATQDFTIKEAGSRPASTEPAYGGDGGGFGVNEAGGNNYSRPEGQNVGNFLSERPSSRVLAPPGGASQISFGAYDAPPPSQRQQYTPKPTGVPYGTADNGTANDFQQRARAAFQSPLPAEENQGKIVYDDPYPPSNQAERAPAFTDLSNQGQPGAYTPGGYEGKEATSLAHFGNGGGGGVANNYSRPEGQNVGNFLSDRPSSRVLAPPGGASQISFG